MARHSLAFARLLIFASLPTIALQAQAVTAGRFLYVISCDARVDKLDTITGRKVETYDLAKRTGKASLIPTVQGTMDSCLASQAVYDRATSSFSTVVPVTNEAKADGTKDYRVLRFSVPGLELVKQESAGESLDAPPHLELQSGSLKILRASDWTPQANLDLSTYGPDKLRIPNQILESSGDRFLLRLFTADDKALVLAVADRKGKNLVRLQGLPTTVAPSAHLAPGGSYVLVEETGTGEKPEKAGRLVLIDALSGKVRKQFSDAHIKDLYFLAISPTGRVVYHASDNYWFLDLGTTFAFVPVSRPISTEYPPLFFASK